MKVLGKGDKERLVAFGASYRRSLIHYAYHHRAEASDEEVEKFFLCFDGYPMTSYGLRFLTERLSKSPGVPPLHPHLLRHMSRAERSWASGAEQKCTTRGHWPA